MIACGFCLISLVQMAWLMLAAGAMTMLLSFLDRFRR